MARLTSDTIKKRKPMTKVDRNIIFSTPRLVKEEAPDIERFIPAPLD